MRGLSYGTELVQWLEKDRDGYLTAQLALNGILCQPFSFHCSAIVGWNEEKLGEYLERQARTMIDRYGDARLGKTEEYINPAEVAVCNEMLGRVPA